MMKTLIVLLSLLAPRVAVALDSAPKRGVLNSRFVYPSRGLIGAYPANEGSGTVIGDWSPLLGYRNQGVSIPRCGNLTIFNSSGTIPFAWNPAPFNLAGRPLRTGRALNDVGFHLGGTFNATRTESDPQNDHIVLPSACSQQVMTAIFITKALADDSDGTTEMGGGFEHPLMGGNQNDDPIGFYAPGYGGFSAAQLGKQSLWGVTSGVLDYLHYWSDHGAPIKHIYCQGDDRVIVLTRASDGLRMYCDGQEVVYFGSSVALLPISAGVLAAPNLQLNNMPRLFPGSIGYIGRDNTNNSPNFNFNQPMNKTVQWMSFHSVVLTKNEILQATYALKYRQRKYARQKPTLVVAVGDSVNDECFSDIGPGANQCTGFNSPNGTTLSAPIDGVDTNIHFNANNVISYDAGFPGGATGGFVRIDRNEVVRITSCTTATSATSCTVQRGCVGGVCSGTGVTHGTGAYVQTAWLAQLRGILKTPATYVNGAISFFDDQVMSRAGVEQNYRKFEGSDQFAKYALTDSGIYGRKIIIGGECINAIGGSRTPDQMELTQMLWALSHQIAGWDVFWTTCTPIGASLPTTSGGTPPDAKNADRVTFNSWIRANYRQVNAHRTGGDELPGPGWPGATAVSLVDTDSDTALGSDHCASVGGAVNEPPCAGVSAPTLSFLDNISHLTSVGSYRFALKVKASLNARGIE